MGMGATKQMRRLSCIILLACMTLAASAQQESLLIGPGDQLSILVFDTPDLTQHVRVTDAGEVPLVMGGGVKLSGLTPGQAAVAIEEALVKGNILNHPHVTVTVDQYATQNISVMGEVRTPGLFPLPTPRGILDVLAMAGGLTELADRKIVIERRATHERFNYIVSNDGSAALDQKVVVYPGDTVLVAKVGVVYVLGDVGRPGGFAMATNDSTISVLEAVALAGGTPPTAVPSHARLIRKTPQGYAETNLPLSDMQKGKVADMPMFANDIVYVPFSYARSMVVNASSIIAVAGSAAVYHF